MSKLIQAFLVESLLSQNYGVNYSKPLLSLIAYSCRFSHNNACSSTPDLDAKNSVLTDYLVGSLNFSKERATSISSSYSRTKSLEKPQEVVCFFKGLGFSDANIQSIACAVPNILFADVEKTLKPKVALFQEFGLCTLISRNPFVLTFSLDRTLRPSISLIKKVLQSDGRCRNKEQVNGDLLRILTRCSTIFYMTSRLEANILYLESRGIVGSQLSSLLLCRTRLFTMPIEKIEQLVSRAADMNFNMGSRMLAHAIAILGCVSIKTLNGKIEVLRVFEFSKDEVDSMFGKWPYIFGLSETNLRCKLEFFLNNLKINKSMLVQNPILLSFSIKERVTPRYKVLEILKSRRLVSTDLSLITAMSPPNQKFFEKYILPFTNDAEELLLAYKGNILDTPEK
ncbi:hypothetical protein C2S53_015322 [Perilla frutescens var. hirtella]|uniref:Uncharacterized protein n=1 Tax=Perilla frutescens var. hirtella TaxID=608512 RepID=A0AAD4JBW5_PERFH|nr:hypothetical protein C2S53_015322 [Perilla frutescens var. hirtella]